MNTEAKTERRVLVVDDDPSVSRLFSRALTAKGFSATVANNGHQALERLDELIFDVIVSDITMPGMTGIQFLKAVRRKDLDIPIILVTGDPQIDSAMEAVEYGAFKYLKKPVDPTELQEIVDHARNFTIWRRASAPRWES